MVMINYVVMDVLAVRAVMGILVMIVVVGDVVSVVVVLFPSSPGSSAIQTISLFHSREMSDHLGVVAVRLSGGIPTHHGHLGQ